MQAPDEDTVLLNPQQVSILFKTPVRAMVDVLGSHHIDIHIITP